MSDIASIQAELIDEFALFDNWMDRYQYIIDLGQGLPEFSATLKTDDNKVEGCQSQVWLHVTPADNGQLHFQGYSDSTIVCGLIALLLRVYSDRQPADIINTEPHFIQAIGLQQHLSPTRSNGLAAMLKRLFAIAQSYQAKNDLTPGQ